MAHQTWPIGLPPKQEQAQMQPQPDVEIIEKVDPYEELLLKDIDGNVTRLSLENGDVIATAVKGPNYGKSCNLTYGRWT